MSTNTRIIGLSLLASVGLFGLMSATSPAAENLTIAMISFFGFALLQYAVRIVNLLEKR